MKLLCIADEECKALWDYYTPDKIEGVDLIIACGDLNRQYLEYLTTMAPVPVLYVHGNHDENYDHHPPEGAICLDDDLFVYHGLRIVGLGMSGFTMSITNSSVQIMYNVMLQKFGGDLYVGIMTVINSVREVISMPVNGLTNSAQPVMGYNYGAGEYKRTRQAIVFISVVSIAYTVVVWLFVHECPEFFIRIFNREGELVEAGVPAMRVYFFGFFMMSLQFAGQAVFVGLGKSKNAVFFSIFRKVIIVIPLILILPAVFNLGTTGILMAEPISNFIGGTACFGTMMLTVWPELKRGAKEKTDQ